MSIDLARSFGIGDKPADLGAAVATGARGVLVRTGYGEDAVRAHGADGVPDAAFVAADLMAAVAWVLLEEGSEGPEGPLGPVRHEPS
jgi:histidinol phosphatase-like enzyme